MPVSNGQLSLDVGQARAWTRGRITAFVEGHHLAWSLVTAGLTLVYVVLAVLQDQGASRAITVGVGVLAVAFVAEFALRLYDSPSRKSYLKGHWIDIVTCLPVVGPFRLLRLVRLLAFIRVGATARAYGVGAATSGRLPGGTGIWVLVPVLITVWLSASYGYYALEHESNPNMKTFGDALYYAFITASTVGYGAVVPVTQEGRILTGVLIFLSIGLLGFASAQVTAKLLPQGNEVNDLKATVDRQCELLEELNARLDAVTGMLEAHATVAVSREDREEVPQLV